MHNKIFPNTNKFLLICLTFFVLQSCSKLEDWNLPEYDGALKWEQIVKNAEWDKRLDHEVTVLNDELYLVGGYNPGNISDDPYFEDVWKSSDGTTWTQILSDAPWFGRRGHSLITFNDGTEDALYLIGGFSVNETTGERAYNNDVWRSTDGKNWIEIQDSTEWTPRMYHKCVVANHSGQNYIYLVGGYTMIPDTESRYGIQYFNDVWRSSNGKDWTNVGITDIGIRAEHAMTIDENGTIYLQGGQHGVIFEAADSSGGNPIRNYEDVWSTSDGETWTNSSNSTLKQSSFLGRTSHEMIFYHDKIWVLPGKSNSLNHYTFTSPQHYGIWTIDMYGNLDIDSYGSAIDARHNYATVIWRDKIWVFGGNTNQNGQNNDIWTGSLEN